jgi:hypothetical protein
MARRSADATGAARKPTELPSVVHTSLYLPERVYEALRKIAFEGEGQNPRCGAGGDRGGPKTTRLPVGREPEGRKRAKA